jgi:glycosyltransferase involved in cell wall biosynthesis
MNQSYKNGLISILVPTRNRPKNVRRLVSSIFKNSANSNNIEILFYVDIDDVTFPNDILQNNIKIIRGPKIWNSLMLNVLYVHAIGEIVMYAADDIEFSTLNWDLIVLEAFNKVPDKILLVFGNDLGSYENQIAIHGFLHRNWLETIGTFAASSRGSLSDLWHTENARMLNRMVYLPQLHIKHIHYRQGDKEAIFDETYKHTYQDSTSWKPIKTYKKLKRERRIDRILLSEKMNPKPKTELNYVIGEFIANHSKFFSFINIDRRRLKSIGNFEIFFLIFSKLIKSK